MRLYFICQLFQLFHWHPLLFYSLIWYWQKVCSDTMTVIGALYQCLVELFIHQVVHTGALLCVIHECVYILYLPHISPYHCVRYKWLILSTLITFKWLYTNNILKYVIYMCVNVTHWFFKVYCKYATVYCKYAIKHCNITLSISIWFWEDSGGGKGHSWTLAQGECSFRQVDIILQIK